MVHVWESHNLIASYKDTGVPSHTELFVRWFALPEVFIWQGVHSLATADAVSSLRSKCWVLLGTEKLGKAAEIHSEKHKD